MDVARLVDEVHRDGTVIDVHTHAQGYLPRYAARVFRRIYRRTMPADLPLAAAGEGRVHALVAKAIGDPMATRWWARSPWSAVEAQLRDIEAETARAGGCLVRSAADLRRARAAGQLAVMLGLEGADAVGHRLDRLDQLKARGVRLIGLVHLGHNQIGTTGLPWQEYIGALRPGRARPRGLTPFGRDVVRRMNALGLVIDLAHADSATLRDVLALSAQPIVVSHTGARSLDDFERYLDDDEVRAVAGAGGLVGLWPYLGHRSDGRPRGVRDLPDLVRHARHLAGVAGAEHLCLGTDLNGLPGVMAGYRGEPDVPLITAALLEGGFGMAEVKGILGGNFLRLLERLDQD